MTLFAQEVFQQFVLAVIGGFAAVFLIQWIPGLFASVVRAFVQIIDGGG